MKQRTLEAGEQVLRVLGASYGYLDGSDDQETPQMRE